MRAALCDDEITALDSLRMLLEKHKKIHTLRSFLSPDLLIKAVKEGECFDIIFMDIEMKQSLNGIDFASILNNISPYTQIIYVTGYNDMFSQRIFLKTSNLCGYLVKPVDPILLDETLQKAWNGLQIREKQKLFIQNKGSLYAIPFYTIYYLESQGHQLLVHTAEDTIICYERLELLKQQLSRQFFQCHKSYLVNMDFIKRIENRQIILKSGEELPISKAKYAETRSAYFTYMSETL